MQAVHLRTHLRGCLMAVLTGSPDRGCLPPSAAAIATRTGTHCSAHPFQFHFTLFLSPSYLRWFRKRRSSCWLRQSLGCRCCCAPSPLTSSNRRRYVLRLTRRHSCMG